MKLLIIVNHLSQFEAKKMHDHMNWKFKDICKYFNLPSFGNV